MRKKRRYFRVSALFLAAALLPLLAMRTRGLEQSSQEPFPEEWALYFGLLHAHTELSDGTVGVEDAFLRAAAVDGLDFFAVTDHSNSFDNADAGAITRDGADISREWAEGKAAAAAVTKEDFVGIFGYEMTWRDSDGFGHISTFRTPGWQSRNQEGFSSLTAYYEVLTGVPGSVSQFSHPGYTYGTFENFAYWEERYDGALSLLEVSGEDGRISTAFYSKALDRGWHVAPTGARNTHGSNWDDGDVRTVILAKELTEESLYEAMAARRVYATEDRDFKVLYKLSGALMGSALPYTESPEIQLWLSDATDGNGAAVEVIVEGGAVAAKADVESTAAALMLPVPAGHAYYYLRLTQADGDIAVTAPVWMEEKPQEPPTEPPTQPEEPTEEPEEPTEEPEEPTEEPEEPTEEPEENPPVSFLPEDREWELYFGLLHAHTDLSDGMGSVETAFSQAAAADNLDFFAVTDHSNSFDNADAGAITRDGTAVSREWAAGKAAAEAVTGEDFVGIFGYEMTWQDSRDLGHINTFNTPGWQSRTQESCETLTGYYDALTKVPGSVSQFNHPGDDYGMFENFAHRTFAYDAVISLLEVGSEGDFTACGAYTRALDMGWHVAPTGSHNEHNGGWGSTKTSRTVVLAEALTEKCLYEAMAERRVYATEDADFSLWYELDGKIMGSITGTAREHTVEVWMQDPTDSGAVRVEVITDGGAVLYAGVTDSPCARITATVPGGYRYCYLRLTQGDGDIAVTAPVWTDDYTDFEISLSAETPVPVPGQEVELKLSVFNEENLPLTLTGMTVFSGEEPVWSSADPGTVASGTSRVFSLSYLCRITGQIRLRAVVTGLVNGESRDWETELTLSCRPVEIRETLLVDGGHSNVGPAQLRSLRSLAEKGNMEVALFTGAIPETGSILVIPPSERVFEDAFLQAAVDFVERGGCLIVCGSAGNTRACEEGNRLLRAVGSTMALGSDTALDETENGGESHQLYPAVFNKEAACWECLTDNQFYRHSGCTVDPGSGTWLVKGFAGTVSSRTGQKAPVLLAWEETPAGGRILAAGSFFLGDREMPLPANRWDFPSANQTMAEYLLGMAEKVLTRSTVADVRKGEEGNVYRIMGYATSGTANRHNRFPDCIYLQDDTGGIVLESFSDPGITVGTPLEVTGRLEHRGEIPVLQLIAYRTLQIPHYRHVPDTQAAAAATDYETNGGKLVQVEARVSAVTLTDDGRGISRIQLTDSGGGTAVVLIEDFISSGRNGTNTLESEIKVGRKVRAAGLLHQDENGISVLRVRNCDEVVYVPPNFRPNPYTGDPVWAIAGVSLASLSAALWLLKKREKT